MIFIYLLLVVLLILTVIILTQTFRFQFLLNWDNDEFYINILCLYPFLKVLIKIEETKPYLFVYIFKIKVYKTKLRIKKRTDIGINLIKSANPININVTTSYGFRDPFTTGIACGALSVAAKFINIDKINQYPNFMSSNDYIHVDATADINVGYSIVNFAKNKNKK